MSRGITAHQAALLATMGTVAQVEVQTASAEPEPEDTRSRQVRRAEARRSPEIVVRIEADYYRESFAVRFDRRPERTHPTNPKRSRI